MESKPSVFLDLPSLSDDLVSLTVQGYFQRIYNFEFLEAKHPRPLDLMSSEKRSMLAQKNGQMWLAGIKVVHKHN